jgi:hypothetical protein
MRLATVTTANGADATGGRSGLRGRTGATGPIHQPHRLPAGQVLVQLDQGMSGHLQSDSLTAISQVTRLLTKVDI